MDSSRCLLFPFTSCRRIKLTGSKVRIARHFSGRKRNFAGERFWARGHAVATFGFELDKARHFIRNQERLDGNADGGHLSGGVAWPSLRRLLCVKPPRHGVRHDFIPIGDLPVFINPLRSAIYGFELHGTEYLSCEVILPLGCCKKLPLCRIHAWSSR